MSVRQFTREVRQDIGEIVDVVTATFGAIGRELAELGDEPARVRQGLVAAVSTILATTMALALEVQSPWWAAISGFMSLMSTGSASVRRALLRLVGTIAGALLGFIMARWLPYDLFAFYLFLGAATMLGVMAMQVSPHGLAWLFLTITAILVLLMSLNNPTQAFEIACNRTIEVGVGVTAAIITARLLQDWHAEPPPVAPGWRHLLEAQWPAVLHGLRSGIAVVTVMLVWVLFDLPEVTEMAITVAVVMSAPVIAGSKLDTRHAVAQRSIFRFIGCLLGGVLALGVLALDITSFVWWLAALGAGVWLCMHVQVGRHGVGYVGTQAGMVFIITLVQGASPPISIMPGIERFVGIVGGLAILLIVSLLIWPTEEERAQAS
jgi:uncharacterized membrane protein YccC